MHVESDIFSVKLHFPDPLFVYSFRLKKHDAINVRLFWKFISQYTVVVPMDEHTFCTYDELDVRDIRFEVPKHLGLESLVFKGFEIPKDEILAKFYMFAYASIMPYRYLNPSKHSNPALKRFKEKEIEKYLQLLKGRFIEPKLFDGSYIAFIVYKQELEENFEPKEGMLVKVRNRMLYGRIMKLEDGKAFVDFGNGGDWYDLSELLRIVREVDREAKPSHVKFLVRFFLRILRKELLTFGLELKQAKLNFEEVDVKPPPLKVKPIFSDAKLERRKQELPLEYDEEGVEVLIDRKLFYQLKKGRFKNMYRMVVRKLVPHTYEAPRIYTNRLVYLRMKDGRCLAGHMKGSVIVPCDMVPYAYYLIL